MTEAIPERPPNRLVRFTPRRTDDLRPDALALVGQEFEVYFAWHITEEDGGSYVGQDAWLPRDYDLWAGWLPDCDLTDVTP